MTRKNVANLAATSGTADEPVAVATVTIAGMEYRATGVSPVIFGRLDGPGVVGLDPNDMGISGVAGSIEWKGVWFVVNRSRKRKLYIDDGTGPQPLDCGRWYAVSIAPLIVRVRGEIYTHSISVVVPENDLARLSGETPSTGTVLAEIRLPDRDREVVVALFEGYLLPFPYHQPWPRTYEQAAQRLGPPWTKDRVRKQVDRLKDRLRPNGPPLDGPRANHDLAEYLLNNNVIGPHDVRPDAP